MQLNIQKIFFSGTLILLNTHLIYGQGNSSTLLIDLLVKKHIAFNESKLNMSGYRIQIYFGAQRSKATEIKVDFTSKFPEVPSYLLYQQPNFKVRIGDFRTHMEAQKTLEQIKSKYAVAFIVKDDINLPFAVGVK